MLAVGCFELINLWLEHEGQGFLCTVEARLQLLISSQSRLLDSLHLLAQDFLLPELHPFAATARLLGLTEDVPSKPPDVALPGHLEPSLRRK